MPPPHPLSRIFIGLKLVRAVLQNSKYAGLIFATMRHALGCAPA